MSASESRLENPLLQATGQDPIKAITEDHALLQTVERIMLVKRVLD